MSQIELTSKDFESTVKPDWCPGCGDHGLLKAMQRALASLKFPYHNLFCVSGIGCSSNFPHFLKTYGVHSLHGRALPVATGAALANHSMKVIVTGGDGDGYGIGAGHFLHAARRNLNIAYFAMNNQIYGLTTGQASPTSEMEMVTKSTPGGVIENPVNPLSVAISAGATFVARGFSGDITFLADLVAKALQHKGFALLDVLSPCVTFNKYNTYPWFKKRTYRLNDPDAKDNSTKHDVTDMGAALLKSIEWETTHGEKIPTGVFYEVKKKTYEDLEPNLRAGPLVKQPYGLKDHKKIMEQFY
ncbi:MAG: 2-oxoacid:ferredoxin oxidoreductase subunit beta [Candidatus Thorarchaeota archaeon]